MQLEITPREALPCRLLTFTINGKDANGDLKVFQSDEYSAYEMEDKQFRRIFSIEQNEDRKDTYNLVIDTCII